MALYLRQSTASQEIPLGYFVDSTDGDTAETGLTIANTDIKIWKTGATTLADKNSGGATHISGGIYYAVLDATDTDTIGPLVVFVHVSGALAVRVECCVLDEAVYDVKFGTTAPATATNITQATGIDVTKISGDSGAADNAEAFFDGTGYAGTNNVIPLVSLVTSCTTVGSVSGNVGGNVVGSVGSVVGAVGSVTGAVGSVTGNVGGNVTGSVGSVASGGIAAASIAAAAANKIADHVLRRTTANVEASSDGDTLGARSLYGAAARLCHKVDISGATLTVTKSDDTTSLTTETLTTDAAAEPVIGKDPA